MVEEEAFGGGAVIDVVVKMNFDQFHSNNRTYLF